MGHDSYSWSLRQFLTLSEPPTTTRLDSLSSTTSHPLTHSVWESGTSLTAYHESSNDSWSLTTTWDMGHPMSKKRASSSASRSKAPVRRSAGCSTTHSGSQAGPHQTRAQADPQPKVVNGGHP
ncbi:hypothetical protein HAX54_015156 [Datura stramonium]|uniref:Uncharacterized protein n=1 Tax=Datura stramonium TaxID=4076 RepID=A0ABS8S2R5_DATST|nr:hypothetical protein [Datura stramonium]